MLKKHWKTGVKFLISFLILYMVFNKIGMQSIWETLLKADIGWLLLAMVIFVISRVLASFRLNFFLKAIHLQVSEWFNLKLYLLGMYYSLLLPTGIGGDGYKVYFLNKKFGTKIKPLVHALLTDRLTGIVAICTFLIILYYFIDFFPDFRNVVWLLLPIGWIGFYLILKYFFKKFSSIFFQTISLALLLQLTQVITAYFLLMAIDPTVDFASSAFIFLFSSIMIALPITIGGIGAREFTFLLSAEYFNLEATTLVTMGLMFYILNALISMVGAYYSFVPKALDGK